MRNKAIEAVDELPESEEYRVWLKRHTKLGTRAIGDTLSRAKRASAFAPLKGPADENQIAFQLRSNPEFMRCTPSVRSQIKKAVVLYRRFLAQR